MRNEGGEGNGTEAIIAYKLKIHYPSSGPRQMTFSLHRYDTHGLMT